MTPGQVNTDLNAFVKDLVNVSVPAELGGEKLFESAFVTRRPTPDFVYPYWFPRLVFERDALELLAPWRIAEAGSWGRPLDNAFRPERLLQQRDFSLHGSVGPECSEQLQLSLWRWSRNAVGLPAWLDTGDLFEASSLQTNPAGIGVAKCPSPGLCAPTMKTLPFPEFELPDQEGRLVTLESFPSVSLLLYWYPKADSPGATAQGSGFEELLPRYRKLKIQVIGVSTGPSLVGKGFANAGNITFPLLSDSAGSLSRALEMNEGSRWACYVGAGRRILRFWPEVDPLHFPANAARELR
jgi:peroxiredoxin Q/BCP